MLTFDPASTHDKTVSLSFFRPCSLFVEISNRPTLDLHEANRHRTGLKGEKGT